MWGITACLSFPTVSSWLVSALINLSQALLHPPRLGFSAATSCPEADQHGECHKMKPLGITLLLRGFYPCENDWRKVGRVRMFHRGFKAFCWDWYLRESTQAAFRRTGAGQQPRPSAQQEQTAQPKLLPAEPCPPQPSVSGSLCPLTRSLDKGHCRNLPLQISMRSPCLAPLCEFTV